MLLQSGWEVARSHRDGYEPLTDRCASMGCSSHLLPRREATPPHIDSANEVAQRRAALEKTVGKPINYFAHRSDYEYQLLPPPPVVTGWDRSPVCDRLMAASSE